MERTREEVLAYIDDQLGYETGLENYVRQDCVKGARVHKGKYKSDI